MVFASRLLGIALNNFLGIIAFLLVPVLLFIALGFTQLWGTFPATLALSLLGSSLGVLVILLLVKAVWGEADAQPWRCLPLCPLF